MKENFSIRMFGDLDYEEMTALIYFENSVVATISQDEGINKMKIHICPFGSEAGIFVFYLSDFFDAIERARQSLIEFREKTTE